MNWERTPEQRWQAHRHRQQLRRQNQAGRRRRRYREVRQQYGIPEPPQLGPPSPGYTAHIWQLAELRYLYRYGWPLPPDWNTSPRPRQPKLNADGDHRHVVAMRLAHHTLGRPDLPTRWIQTRITRAVVLELAAANRSDDTRRPILLRSAAHLACNGNLPDWAQLITAYGQGRYPEAINLQWPTPQELAASRERRARDQEQFLLHTLTRIAVIAGGLAEHHPDTSPLAGQISELVTNISKQRISCSWHASAGPWAPPDHNPGIDALHSSAQAVKLLRPDWPEAADLFGFTQDLLTKRFRG